MNNINTLLSSSLLYDLLSSVTQKTKDLKQNVIKSVNGVDQDIQIPDTPYIDPSGVVYDDITDYTAFEVTATESKKTQAITLLVAGQTIGASVESIGFYDVDVDWGDGTISRHTDTTIVTSKTGANNQAVWKNQSMEYYNYTFAENRIDVNYTHTYAEPGKYIIKILGTTYYQFRCASNDTNNIISRCMQYDLPLYSGITRLQGAFQQSKALVKVNCPKNYKWPTNVKDTSQLFDSCFNLVSVGQMTFPNTTLSMRRAFYNTKIEKGVYIPDSVLNCEATYSGCSQLTYVPNTGKNNRTIYYMFKDCGKLTKIDGYISKQSRCAQSAFINTVSLINTPKFEQGIIWGNDDTQTNEAWKKGGTTYDMASVLTNMFYNSGIITAPQNLGTCKASLNINANYMFKDCHNLTSLPALPNGVQSCKSTFQYCYNAVRLHKDSNGNIDTIPSTATDLTSMFSYCYSLIETQAIPNNVTTATECYYHCNSLTDSGDVFSGTYTGLTSLVRMFAECKNLTVFSSHIPLTVTDMRSMFAYCRSLKTMYYTYDWLNVNTPITDFSYAFYYCNSLNKLLGSIPNTVTNAANAFNGCFTATTLPTFYYSGQSACTNANNLYNGCQNLNCTIRIPKNLTNYNYMFYGCKKLQLNLNSIINSVLTSNQSISVDSMFTNCQSLYGSQKDINAVGNRLWNSTKTFTNTSIVFSGCSRSLRIYIPTSWGGLKQ